MFYFLYPRSVHICACMYWRVKIESGPDGVEQFLESKDVDSTVRSLSSRRLEF